MIRSGEDGREQSRQGRRRGGAEGGRREEEEGSGRERREGDGSKSTRALCVRLERRWEGDYVDGQMVDGVAVQTRCHGGGRRARGAGLMGPVRPSERSAGG